MEETIPITAINDFLFCPKSLYWGNIARRSLAKDSYQESAQKAGTLSHGNVDSGRYSTRKTVFSGFPVYCEKYGLMGVIDVYDSGSGTIIERKRTVRAVWEGFRMQVFAQALSLMESDFPVKRIKIHSLTDNRTYDVGLPARQDVDRLEEILGEMRSFSPWDEFDPDRKRCPRCPYRHLCDSFEGEDPK